MSIEPIPAMKSVVTDGPEGLTVVMPARRHAPVLFLVPLWLAFWLFGGLTAARGVQSTAGATPFLVIWLTVWGAAGLLAISSWLWMFAGHERLVVGSGRLMHGYQLFAFEIPREYDLAAVRHLRSTPNLLSLTATSFGARMWGLGTGAIAFDYGSKTVYVGSGIDEAEGGMIVRKIRGRHTFADDDEKE